VKRRATGYESVDEMQADLDVYIETYNRNRPRDGGADAVSGAQEGDPEAPGAGRSQPKRR